MKASLLIATAASAALATAPAQARSVDIERSSPASAGESELQGQPTLFFLGAIVAVAIGIFLLIDDDDAESP